MSRIGDPSPFVGPINPVEGVSGVHPFAASLAPAARPTAAPLVANAQFASSAQQIGSLTGSAIGNLVVRAASSPVAAQPTSGAVSSAASAAGGSAPAGVPSNLSQATTDPNGTDTTTVTNTLNADGTTTYDVLSTVSYGDPSAAGTDTSGTDPASIPNGGTDTLDVSVTTGPNSTTVTIDSNSADSYSVGGTITSATDTGNWTYSGSDSTKENDVTTYNNDGTSSATDTLVATSTDKFSANVSGSSASLPNFTLTVGGTDSFKTNNNDAPGNNQDSEDDNASRTANVTATTSDGATVATDVSEAIGNKVDTTPSTTTTTKTDKGGDSFSDKNSGGTGDGGSFNAQQTTSDTYDDKDTTVNAVANGQSTLVSDNATNTTTKQDDGKFSVNGVSEGNGSSVQDSEVVTGSGNSSNTHTTQITPGSDIETSQGTGTRMNDTSGTDSGGAFDFGGSSTSDNSYTATNGDITASTDNPTYTPGPSQGTTPTGSINQDVQGIEMQASIDPPSALTAADQQAAGDQFVLAQAPAPAPPLPPLPADNAPNQPFPTPTAAQLGNLSIAQLESLSKAYTAAAESAKRSEDAVLTLATYLKQTTPKFDVAASFMGLSGTLLTPTKVREIAAGAFQFAAAKANKLADQLADQAQKYKDEVLRLDAAIQAINAAIANKILNP